MTVWFINQDIRVGYVLALREELARVVYDWIMNGER